MISKTLINMTHRVLALTAVTGALIALAGIILVFTTGGALAGHGAGLHDDNASRDGVQITGDGAAEQ